MARLLEVECGVALHDALLARRWLTEAYDVTPAGAEVLSAWGVDVEAARGRPHLAGALAAGIGAALIESGWFVRRAADSRSLRLTDAGRAALVDLGCDLSPA